MSKGGSLLFVILYDLQPVIKQKGKMHLNTSKIIIPCSSVQYSNRLFCGSKNSSRRSENNKGEVRGELHLFTQEISPVFLGSPRLRFTDDLRYKIYICNFSFFARSSSTVSRYISSGTQQSTGQTEAHCGSS